MFEKFRRVRDVTIIIFYLSLSSVVHFTGTETTSSFLEWCIFYSVKHPEVQDKIYEEIESKIGNRDLTLRDSTELPYTMAFFEEVARHSPGKYT